MRAALALLFVCLAAPAMAQTGAPAAQPPPNPYSDLFTSWDGVNRDSLHAEARTASPPPEAPGNAIPAYSPLEARSQAEAVALGERVGQVVRAGDCAEGERIAREAGDFALIRAVRDHCRSAR